MRPYSDMADWLECSSCGAVGIVPDRARELENGEIPVRPSPPDGEPAPGAHGAQAGRPEPLHPQGRKGGKGRREGEGDGEGEGGEGEPKLVKLSMDPSGSRMLMVTGGYYSGADSEHWQRVTKREAKLRTSRKGNLMIMLTLDLEGKPARIWETFVLNRGVRSYAGKRYSRLFGTPLPTDPAQALAVAQDRMGSIRRVACRMEGNFGKIKHVERSAWSAEEKRAAGRR